MTWYLSGPMTGYDDLNHPAFAYAATTLRSRGLTVLSPHETDPTNKETWRDFLRDDLRTLAGCDGIVLLRGWTRSRGACLELRIAVRLGLAVQFFNERSGELVDMA